MEIKIREENQVEPIHLTTVSSLDEADKIISRIRELDVYERDTGNEYEYFAQQLIMDNDKCYLEIILTTPEQDA